MRKLGTKAIKNGRSCSKEFRQSESILEISLLKKYEPQQTTNSESNQLVPPQQNTNFWLLKLAPSFEEIGLTMN